MHGARIKKAREALEIFIRSLPADCRFSVCSFGTRFTWMQSTEGQSVIPYNEENQKKALAEIAVFDANHGGTDIYTPLTQAKDLVSRLKSDDEDDTIEKRVFVLTDG